MFSIEKSSFLKEEQKRIPHYFSTNRSKLSGFKDKNEFQMWYFENLEKNDFKCHYCDTSILQIRQLLNNELMRGRKVGKNGNGLRGPNFEIDKKNPFGSYNEENCVLSCYYCNNDKSNTFDYKTYKDIVGPARKNVWDTLLKK
jgi:hypothetical protein